MHTFAEKPPATPQAAPAKPTVLARARIGDNPETDSIVHLQRTIGNHAVQRLLSPNVNQPNSTGRERISRQLANVAQHGGNQLFRAMSVSQPGDPHEVEAEQTARAVMEHEHMGHEHMGHEAQGEKEKEKEEHHTAMLSRCPCDEAQRQPEAAHGKDKEEEEKRKHHVMTKADRSSPPRHIEHSQ